MNRLPMDSSLRWMMWFSLKERLLKFILLPNSFIVLLIIDFLVRLLLGLLVLGILDLLRRVFVGGQR